MVEKAMYTKKEVYSCILLLTRKHIYSINNFNISNRLIDCLKSLNLESMDQSRNILIIQQSIGYILALQDNNIINVDISNLLIDLLHTLRDYIND